MDVTNTHDDNDENSKVLPTRSASTEPCDYERFQKDFDRPVPLQPIDAAILSQFKRGKWTFLPSWFSACKWMSLCMKQKKIFCSFCRHSKAHMMMIFFLHSKPGFTDSGFNNYKMSLEKFVQHAYEGSMTHRETAMKC